MLSRLSWDDTWIDVARTIGMRSKCCRSSVGAVIVSPENRILATGYNGPPANWRPPAQFTELPHDYFDSCEHWCPRAKEGPTFETQQSYTDCFAVHAELNALMFVDRSLCENGKLYVTSHVCWTCAKAVANSGLRRVIVAPDKNAPHRRPDESYALLRSCHVEVSEMMTPGTYRVGS